MNRFNYLSNAHTHTDLSDGHATLEEMVEEAYRQGFISLGITDHCPVFYENDFQIKNIKEYVSKINRIKNDYLGRLEIICGIEIDNDCSIDIPCEISYIISSLHTLKISNNEVFRFLQGADNFQKGVKKYFQGDYIKACVEFFKQSYISATRKETDIIGHFDSFCKYNYNNRFFDENHKKYLDSAFEVIDGIMDNKPDVIFEINTGGVMRAGRPSPYPSYKILNHIFEKKGRIIVNSDAHRPHQINAYFDDAFEIMESIGFKTVVRIREKGFEELSIKELKL